MKKLIDLKKCVGRTFTYWKVLNYIPGKIGSLRSYYFDCRCKCGKIKRVNFFNLVSGKSKSCGCIRGDVFNLLGKRFRKLIVVAKSNKRSTSGGILWKCRCDCGKICFASTGSLRYGDSRSCGCLIKQNYFHVLRTTHGQSKSPEAIVWLGMKQRCNNKNCPAYKDYGGRGISVYKPWIHSFETFLQYLKDNNMYPKPKNMSMDRIKNDGNYEPGNIKWSTSKEQNNNRRRRKLKCA